MTILDRTKIRPDILKLMDKSEKIQMKGAIAFISLEENKGRNLPEIMKKITKGNEDFFQKISNIEASIDDLYGFMTDEEMLFLAKLFRYATDYMADYDLKKNPIPDDVKVESVDINGIPAEWQIVPNAIEEHVLLYFHGGGQILMSPKSHRILTVALGEVTNMRVLSVDYRLAPEHPYPAGLEDCVSSYKWLLSKGIKPENIVIGGDSAGGNQTLATLLKLRDEGISLPAGAIALSPGIDYTTESKTITTNAATDPILADVGLFWWISAYLAGADPYDPYISPVHADLKGLPPILVQVSKIEMLYDHSTRFVERAKAAGVDAILQEWDEMIHVWQGFGLQDLPEAREAVNKIGEFVKNLFN